MGQDPSASGANMTEIREPEQIRRDIEATRHELGETVEALAEKTDVKAHAKQKVSAARRSPVPLVVVGVLGLAAVGVYLVRR
jgi:hypothetical protein